MIALNFRVSPHYIIRHNDRYKAPLLCTTVQLYIFKQFNDDRLYRFASLSFRIANLYIFLT